MNSKNNILEYAVQCKNMAHDLKWEGGSKNLEIAMFLEELGSYLKNLHTRAVLEAQRDLFEDDGK